MANIVWDELSLADLSEVGDYLRARSPGRGRVTASEAVRWALRLAAHRIELARAKRQARQAPRPEGGRDGVVP